MFFGAVPTDVIQQLFKIIDFRQWSETYVCCSGGFRIERGLLQAYPGIIVRSNDVSIFSTAIAKIALGEHMDIKFHSKLSWVEDRLQTGSFLERTAAMMVVFDMARHLTGNRNRYKDSHLREYERVFPALLEKTSTKVGQICAQMPIASYFAGDWLQHVDAAIAGGHGIACFPPFFRGDYEKQFELLHDNIDWPAPSYPMYDPATLPEHVQRIVESGVPYCILTDQHIEGQKPVLEYVTGRKVPHFCYANTGHSSYRHFTQAPEPFKYTPVDIARVTKDSKISIVECDYKYVNFLKDIYLQRNIVHTGGMMNFLVYIDGMLVGALVYTLSKYNTHNDDETSEIYLLSDVTVSREAKFSKLVARLAGSNTVLRRLNVRYLSRFNLVVTTARTKNPVSMKYRGIYELLSKRPADNPEEGNILQYGIRATDDTPQDMFNWWWKSYGRKANEEARRKINVEAKAKRDVSRPATPGSKAPTPSVTPTVAN
jgi:hypothetical protein